MSKRYKYSKTFHFEWTDSISSDDKLFTSMDFLKSKEIVITAKLDGENTTMYSDYIHARSVDASYHESRTWINKLHGEISYLLKKDERICGENVAAEHSIHYKNLESFFYVFSYWIDNICQSWDDTLLKCSELGLITVPILYRGKWDDKIIEHLTNTRILNGNDLEGYVVRIADAFLFEHFHDCVAKYVRPDHVQTDEHWMSKPVVWNEWKIK
jgi:hypothetical protein